MAKIQLHIKMPPANQRFNFYKNSYKFAEKYKIFNIKGPNLRPFNKLVYL